MRSSWAQGARVCVVLAALLALPHCKHDAASNVVGDAGQAGEAPGDGGAVSGGRNAASGSGAMEGGARASGGTAGDVEVGGAPNEGGEAGAGGDISGMRCVLPGKYCLTTNNCAWHKRCDNARCTSVAEGTTCTASEECGNAQYCKSGACKNRALVDPSEDCLAAADQGKTCPEGAECYAAGNSATGSDSLDQCFNPLTNIGYCGDGEISCKAGYYCPSYWDSEPQPCKKRGALAEACSREQADACLDGLSCNFGQCQAAEATEGSSCEPEVTFGIGHRQQVPRACAAGLYCQKAGETEGKCAPAKSLGASCETWDACLDGYCQREVGNEPAGTCTALAVGSPCGADRSCPAGAYCRFNDGTCGATLAIGEPCNDNPGACAPGSECRDVSAGRICVKGVDLGEDCTDAFCKSDISGSFAAICVNVSP